ncbi:MAG: hypothetical protein M5R41_01710 [Bacteroidia bacterium]|nr:hypothetical protein [Bacteroidia bacterium]
MKTHVSLMIIILAFAGVESGHGQSMMRMYRYTYSIAGFFQSSHSSADMDQGSGGVRIGGETEREVLQFSTRNGFFVLRHLAIGGEFAWEHRSESYQPDPNPVNFRSRDYANRLFVGPWARWYIPASMRWYTALELSIGYVRQNEENEESTSVYVLPKTTSTGNGVGINAGLGMGYLLSRGMVLDLTARYGAGWLDGAVRVPGNPDRDLQWDYGELHFLLGLQLLI